MSNLRQLFLNLKTRRLPAAEKTAIRGRLLELMKLRPAEKKYSLFVFSWRSATLVLSVLLIFVLGGGTVFAAAGSVPGNPLYEVKVNFNEPVKVALAFSAAAQAEVHSKLAQERLREAEELASRDQLDAAVEAAVVARLQTHLDRVSEKIAELESAGRVEEAAAVNSNLEAALQAHEDIIVKLEDRQQGQTDDEGGDVRRPWRLREVLNTVQPNVRSTAEARTQSEAKVSSGEQSRVKSAAENKRDSAKNTIESVQNYLNSRRVRSNLSEESKAKAEARLVEAERLFAEGEAKFAAEAYGEAYVLFQTGARVAQHARVLIDAGLRYGLDIETNLRIQEVKGESEIVSESETDGPDAEEPNGSDEAQHGANNQDNDSNLDNSGEETKDASRDDLNNSGDTSDDSGIDLDLENKLDVKVGL